MRKNQLYLPLNLEKIIEPNESVRTLDEICEQLDYTELNKTYLRKGRIEAATPKAMFKILVYGYMTGNYSSRKIEEACKNNINFMCFHFPKKAALSLRDKHHLSHNDSSTKGY